MGLLELKNINKSFADNLVLSDVSLSFHAGEIHSIVGENGAGKSTLMKIIGGIYRADGGAVYLNGKLANMRNPIDAYRAGIGIVHQELSLADNMTVAQNVFANREPIGPIGFVRWKKLYQDTENEFQKIGVAIKPDVLVKTLSIGMQQIVEIVKVLSQNINILIFDEPTSALSDSEAQNMFSLLVKLKEQGKLIIFISHKLNEVCHISDRVSVLRDGKYIGTLEHGEIEEDRIISMMVGRDLSNLYPPKSSKLNGDIVLETKNLSRVDKFHDVSITVRSGEILGIFGLVGAGRTEFAYSLFGADRIDSGKVTFEGEDVTFKSPTDAIAKGVCYLSEDRKRLGLFVNMIVANNIVASSLKKFINRSGFLEFDKMQVVSLEYVERLNIQPANCISNYVSNLSGGNQQKVLLAKWITTNPKLLIVDEPTRGVDVGAKAKIHSILRDLAEAGLGIIMISSELPEILGLSDRVAVMNNGKLITVLDNNDLSEEMILNKAFNKHVVGL